MCWSCGTTAEGTKAQDFFARLCSSTDLESSGWGQIAAILVVACMAVGYSQSGSMFYLFALVILIACLLVRATLGSVDELSVTEDADERGLCLRCGAAIGFRDPNCSGCGIPSGPPPR